MAGARGSSIRPAVLPLAAVAAIAAVVGALSLTGAAASPALGDPGALVRWGLPVIQVAVQLAAALTIGALGLTVMVIARTAKPQARHEKQPPTPAWRRVMTIADIAAAAWFVLGCLQIVFTYASLSGLGLAGPGLIEGVQLFVTQISLGKALGLTTVAALLVAGGALVSTRYAGALWTFVGSLVALIPWAATGHAAGSGDHMTAMSASWLHSASVSVWVGGLAALGLVWPLLDAPVVGVRAAAVRRYSHLAGWCYALVVVSGVGAAWVRLASPTELFTSRYGQVLLAKIVILVALGALGLAQRRRVVARLEHRGNNHWAHAVPDGARPATLPATGEPATAAPGQGAASGTRTDSPRGPAVAGRWREFLRLAATELVLMGVAVGLAVGLAASAPPVSNVTSPSLVEQLTGVALPAAPTTTSWVSVWRVDLLFGCALAAGVGVYAMWAWRLARRGDRWPPARTISWMGGMAVMVWALLGAPAAYGHLLFSYHMVLHMTVAMLAPMLLALGAPVTLLVRAVPARGDGSRGPREWMLAVVHSRWGRFFANPVVAAINFVASMVLFYYTPLFDLALSTHLGHIAMVIHFTVVGYLFVNGLIGIDPGPARPSYPLRMVLLFSTMVFHAFFGLAVISSTTVLGAPWFDRLGVLYGIDRLADQATGGAITWGIGEIPTLVLAVALVVQWTRDDERLARRQDRLAERTGDAELQEYNAMLARLAGEREEHPTGSPKR